MIVLLVNTSIDPVTGGGTATRTVQLARSIQKDFKVECIILSTDQGLDDTSKQKYNDLKTVLLPCLNDRFYIPYFSWTKLKKIIDKVSKFVKNKKKIMVFLDSNHTYSHVKKELISYSNFVTKGSYLIVFDTIIADISKTFFKNRIWNSKNNPKNYLLDIIYCKTCAFNAATSSSALAIAPLHPSTYSGPYCSTNQSAIISL